MWQTSSPTMRRKRRMPLQLWPNRYCGTMLSSGVSWCIQRRLFRILCTKTKRHVLKTPFVLSRHASLEVLAATSRYIVSFVGNRSSCLACKSSLSLTPVGVISEWLKTACTPIRTSFTRPEPIQHCQIQFGRQVAASSHSMHNFEGCLFFKKCGNCGVQKFLLLSRPCPPRKAGAELFDQDW